MYLYLLSMHTDTQHILLCENFTLSSGTRTYNRYGANRLAMKGWRTIYTAPSGHYQKGRFRVGLPVRLSCATWGCGKDY